MLHRANAVLTPLLGRCAENPNLLPRRLLLDAAIVALYHPLQVLRSPVLMYARPFETCLGVFWLQLRPFLCEPLLYLVLTEQAIDCGEGNMRGIYPPVLLACMLPVLPYGS